MVSTHPPDHFAKRVIDLNSRRLLSKAKSGKETAKIATALVKLRIPCQIVAMETSPPLPSKTVDMAGEVLKLDPRRMFRELTEPGGTNPSESELAGVSLAEIAKFSGTEALSSFGARLREARKEKRVRQEEIGVAVGVTRQTIAAWEAARAKPESLSEGRVKALAAMLGVRFEWLWYGQEPMREADAESPQAKPSIAAAGEQRAELKRILKELRPIIRKLEDLAED